MARPGVRGFPLLMREVKAFGVRRIFYAIRTAPALLAIPVLILASWASYDLATVENFGRFVGQICLLFQLAVAVLAAPLWASESLSREKDEDALPLLLLADIRGYDIVLSKAAGAFGPAAFTLCAVLPIMTAGTFVGAPVGVLTAHMAVMLGLAFFAVGAGLFFATLRINAMQAATAAIGAAFALCAAMATAPVFLDPLSGLSPLQSWESLQFMAPGRALSYGATAAIPSLGGLVLMLAAWLRLPGLAVAAPAVAATRRRRALFRPGVAARILLRTGSGVMSGVTSLWAKALLVIFFILLGVVPALGGLALFLLVAFDIFGAHRRLRESAALDDLLTTPLTDFELARAMFTANAVRLWPVLPGMAAGQFIGTTYLSGGASPIDGGALWIAVSLVPVPAAALTHYLFVIALACAVSIYLRGLVFQLAIVTLLYAILNAMIYAVAIVAYALLAGVILALVGDEDAGFPLLAMLAVPLAVLGPGAGLKALSAWIFYREFLRDFGKLVRVETGMGHSPAPGERW